MMYSMAALMRSALALTSAGSFAWFCSLVAKAVVVAGAEAGAGAGDVMLLLELPGLPLASCCRPCCCCCCCYF
ncbi:hypothetical protein B0T09DRAFT_336947 [Sordaria sp. MPI-SDFR-AT-0083]|nr:hypothetical protein B0T09DRAFT_336947 [Sordaria sp. MPI-SDFR-AT-0083]